MLVCLGSGSFLCGAGVRVQGLLLGKQVLYCLSHFALVIWEMGSQELFARAPQITVLPISVSQVARSTGVNHGCPALHHFKDSAGTTTRDSANVEDTNNYQMYTTSLWVVIGYTCLKMPKLGWGI
jgi:hypothetical protein